MIQKYVDEPMEYVLVFVDGTYMENGETRNVGIDVEN